ERQNRATHAHHNYAWVDDVVDTPIAHVKAEWPKRPIFQPIQKVPSSHKIILPFHQHSGTPARHCATSPPPPHPVAQPAANSAKAQTWYSPPPSSSPRSPPFGKPDSSI